VDFRYSKWDERLTRNVNFLKNQTTWRFVQRVDGQPWMDKKVTPQDGSTAVSPFVGIAT